MFKTIIGFDKGIHTIALARIVSLIGIIATVAQTVDWAPLVPAWAMPLVLLGIGVAIELARRYKADDV